VVTLLVDGKIKKQVRRGTTVGDAAWANVFTTAGIPTVVEPDMHSWLRSHAALVAPLMSIGTLVLGRGAGITWSEARRFAIAMADGFSVVRALGNAILPASVATVGRLPTSMVAAILWLLSRTAMLRDLGRLGPAESRMLIDMMSAAAPGQTTALLAIRP
jgi:2-dehydropantoate 2-reductase